MILGLLPVDEAHRREKRRLRRARKAPRPPPTLEPIWNTPEEHVQGSGDYAGGDPSATTDVVGRRRLSKTIKSL